MQQIRLDSDRSSLVLDLTENTIPRMIYWGSLLPASTDLYGYASIAETPVFQAGLDHPYRLNLFPETGSGFKGKPALMGTRKGKDWSHSFKLVEADPKKNGIRLRLADATAQLALDLEIRLDFQSDLLCLRSTLTNLADAPYDLIYCAAPALDIPPFCRELLTFQGCWTGEFSTHRAALQNGVHLFENRTGRTSHETFPGLILGTPGFTENQGTVFGSHLGWSGNSTFFAEIIPDGTCQIQMAELLLPGEIRLEKDHSYISPWLYAGYSHDGLNGLSHKFHQHLRASILPASVSEKKRPVTFNSWEAVYFDHHLETLKAMATKAAGLGFERFVLDDGWFQKRADDTQALGDWQVDPDKYPQGLGPLIDHVKESGLEFGIWVEPEMINPDSHLFKTHPDWIIKIDGQKTVTGRHQLVLNMNLPQVRDFTFDWLCRLLSFHDIDYLKWDMNRILTHPGHGGRPAVHDQVTEVYGLIDKLRAAFPDVEIETCASGGGRVDFEMLGRTHRFWASDSNDPFQRQIIQKGASLFFPPEIMGSHIGPETCHTSGRITPLGFRALTGFFYHFGAEFDLFELDSDQEKELGQYIDLHKQYRPVFHNGLFVRLDLPHPFRNGYGVVTRDLQRGLFCIVQMEIPAQTDDRQICFSHLDPKAAYRVKLVPPVHSSILDRLSSSQQWLNGFTLPGSVLMERGVSIFMPWPGTGVLLELNKVENSA